MFYIRDESALVLEQKGITMEFFHSDPFGLYEQFHRISQVFTPELVQFQLDEIQVHFRTTLDFAIYAFPRK